MLARGNTEYHLLIPLFMLLRMSACLLPRRVNVKWIDATDLNQWADRRDSQALLPEVLRRLVYATVAGPRRVSFPSGESVQFPGWDGYVEALTGTQFVPEGISCWELGTASQPKGKANDDYEKERSTLSVLILRRRPSYS